MLFVNVFHVHQCYGGPEEGGWWFNSGQLIQCVPVETKEDGEKIKKHLEEGAYSNEGSPPLHSAASCGVYQIQIDDKPGEDYPKERPYYE